MAVEAGAARRAAHPRRAGPRLAASVVDGDLHRQLSTPTNYTDAIYTTARSRRWCDSIPPIPKCSTSTRWWSATAGLLRAGHRGFAGPASGHELRASEVHGAVQIRKEYESDWLQQIAAGNTWVTPTFQQSTTTAMFLTAHTPILDSKSVYSGFVGVDFDLQYYLAQEARFRRIRNRSLAVALLAALLIGFLAARFHFDVHHRMEEHYHTSIRDGLTGPAQPARRDGRDRQVTGAAHRELRDAARGHRQSQGDQRHARPRRR